MSVKYTADKHQHQLPLVTMFLFTGELVALNKVKTHQYILSIYGSFPTCSPRVSFPQHASADVERMVLGNKCDVNDKRQVSKERGEKVGIDLSVIMLL